MPSGRLCKAMAKTNSQMRPQRSWPGPQGPVFSCSCGVNSSSPSISSTPSAMPMTTTPAPSGLLPSICAAASNPGSSSEKALAASIIPAANPSKLSSTRCGTARSISAGSAPSAVVANPAAPPRRARRNPGAALPPANCARLWMSKARTPIRASPNPSVAGACSRAWSRNSVAQPGLGCVSSIAVPCRLASACLADRDAQRLGDARAVCLVGLEAV